MDPIEENAKKQSTAEKVHCNYPPKIIRLFSCEVSTGCPFDLNARSWFCEESDFPEGSNGLSPECPTDHP
jgi:hypothetical protein